MNSRDMLLGLLLIISLILAIGKALGKPALLLPLSLIIIFLGGHLMIVYTPIYPFKIYARYMMIPALGLTLLVASFLGRFKERLRLAIVAVLLIVFIPTIVINSQAYKTELAYWQTAQRRTPGDLDINMQLGDSYMEKGDYLSAELIFNGLLQKNLQIQTALFISLHYATIELHRADYESLERWLSSMESLESTQSIRFKPSMRYSLNGRRSQAYIALGKNGEGERLLLQNIKKFPRIKESYSALYTFYVGREMWEKAGKLESAMKRQFRNIYKDLDTAKLEKEASSKSIEEMTAFYMNNINYAKAIETMENSGPFDTDEELLYAKLHYLEGDPKSGAAIISALAEKEGNDPTLLRRIGDFYLREFARVEEALVYYDRSFEADPNQEGLSVLRERLRKGYLEKLNPVWAPGN
jgi:tetratricopeptide (TPR) repeat protein